MYNNCATTAFLLKEFVTNSNFQMFSNYRIFTNCMLCAMIIWCYQKNFGLFALRYAALQ